MKQIVPRPKFRLGSLFWLTLVAASFLLGRQRDFWRVPLQVPLLLQDDRTDVGLNGHSPVTLAETSKRVPGDDRWGAIHRGTVYLLESRIKQDRFLANPDAFLPALSGGQHR